MQLRLGLEGEAEPLEVWATLEARDRVVVIERLAAMMMANAVAPTPARREEESDEDIEGGEGAGDVTRIA